MSEPLICSDCGEEVEALHSEGIYIPCGTKRRDAFFARLDATEDPFGDMGLDD